MTLIWLHVVVFCQHSSLQSICSIMPTYIRRTSVRHSRNAQRLRRGRKNQTCQPALINTLNHDCLAKIFGYLPIRDKFNVQAVCRHWRKNRQLAWRDVRALNFNHLELIPFFQGDGGGVQRILKECGCYLHELTMKFLTQSNILPIISEYCHNLTRLDISFRISETTYTQWFPQMQRLKYLRFQATSQHFSENFFQTLPHENLTELHLLIYLYKPRYYLPPAASSALERLKKLSILTLRGFPLTTDVLRVINQKTSLTYLFFENCSTTEREPLHLDHLTELEHLNLIRLSGVNNSFLTQLSENCKNLKFLDLSDCNNISNEGITKLQVLPQLETLILDDITQINDEPLSKLQSLKRLECADCYNVGDDGIIKLIKYAPKLEYLDLTGSNVSARVLTNASEMLRRRINDITLEISVDRDLRRHWNEDDCPPLLVVTYNCFGSYDSDSSDSTSDSDSRYFTDSSDIDDSSDTDECSDCNDTSDAEHSEVSNDTSCTYNSCDTNSTSDDDEIED